MISLATVAVLIAHMTASSGCYVSSEWGDMTISPWWGSTASSMYAIISNSPVSITSFEIRGADQTDNEYQQCVYQNLNAFQCTISGGALTEPASVRLNGGDYSGVDIIESMAGSAVEYPLSSCTTDSGNTQPPTAPTKTPTAAPTPKPTPRPTPRPSAPTAPTAPTPPPTGSSSSGDKQVIGYYASWQWYDRSKLAQPLNMDFSKVTIVNFAFFQPDTAGYIFGTDSWADPQVLFGPQNWNPSDSSSNAADYRCHMASPNQKSCGHYKVEQGLISLVHAAGARIFPSLGGWTLSDNFPVIAASATKRALFAEQCVELIKEYGFDGIDLDWEYPAYAEHSGTPEDTANFVLLLQTLRDALDAHSAATDGPYYEITAAVGCGPSTIEGYDIPSTAPLLDQINLMTYDFFGAWGEVTGANAPLYYQGFPEGFEEWSVDGCVANWKEGGAVDSQLNIGLPFYGRSFVGATGPNQQHGGVDKVHWGVDEGVPQYFNIESKLSQMTVQRDSVSHTQMAWFSGGGYISFDDEQAICDKVDYAQNKGLNGFIIWELSGDLMADLSTPLLDTVNNKLDNPGIDCSQYADASAGFTADDGSSNGGGSGAVVAVVCALLFCIAVAAGFAVWRWKRSGSDQKKAVPDAEEVDDAEMEMEVEVEVANETVTTTAH